MYVREFRIEMCVTAYNVLFLNLYLTEFTFVVRIHPTEFPFKSLRVSDNKCFVSCERSVMK